MSFYKKFNHMMGIVATCPCMTLHTTHRV